jgi:hypothetical protein
LSNNIAFRLTAAFAITMAINSSACATEKLFYVQVASYDAPIKARASLKQLQHKISLPLMIHEMQINGRTSYQVAVGPFKRYHQAELAKKSLRGLSPTSFIRSYEEISSINASSEPTRVTTHPKYHQHLVDEPTLPSKAALIKQNKSDTSRLFNAHPYPIRAIGQGTLAQLTNFFDGDLMVPLLGNNNWIGYIDGEGKKGDDSEWLGSAGGGWRGILAGRIWGGYLFMDRNQSRFNNSFWAINPGVEMMTSDWDGHINGYIPTSNSRKSLGLFYGEQLGYDTVSFVKRTQFDHLYRMQEVTGPGIDGEIGYTWKNLKNARTFIGGYHFNLSQGPEINGVEGGIELPVASNISLLVHDAYDQTQNNTVMATLRVTLDGIKKHPSKELTDRMLDPIQRHLGSYQTGAGIPIVKLSRDLGKQATRGNIWFFSSGSFNLFSGEDSCTFEHPCGVLDNTAISGINGLTQNASFYISTGDYAAQPNGLNLFNSQSFYGRNSGFKRAAQGSNRPVLNSSLFLAGNNTIDSLQINANAISPVTNNSPLPSGVRPLLVGIEVETSATGSNFINNTSITTNGSTNVDTAAVRLLSNNASLTISGSTLSSTLDTAPGFYSNGIINQSNGLISIISSTVTSNALGGTGTVNLGGAFGIINPLSGSIDVQNSTINGYSINSTDAEGIQNTSNGTININNSTINSVVINGADNSQNKAIFNINGIVTVSNSVINADSSMGGSNANSTYGVANGDVPTTPSSVLFTVINTRINVLISGNTNALSEAAGVSNFGSVSLQNAQLSVAGINTVASVFGAINSNAGRVLSISHSIIRAINSGTGSATGLFNQGITELRSTSITANTSSGAASAVTNAGGTIVEVDNNNTCRQNGLFVPCQ